MNFSLDSKLGLIPVFRVINEAVTSLDDNLLELQTILDKEFEKLGFDAGTEGQPRVTLERIDYNSPEGTGERNDLVFGIDIRKQVDLEIDQNIDIQSLIGEIHGINPSVASALDQLFKLEGNYDGRLSIAAGLKLDLGLNLYFPAEPARYADLVLACSAFIAEPA